MNKKILIVLGVLVLCLASCDTGSNFSDGTINVSVTDLDQLTGFTMRTSNVSFDAYDRDTSDFVAGTTVSNIISKSLSFDLGVPSFIFTGGKEYDVDVFVDINGNDIDDEGIDYWLKDYRVILVDGDQSISVNSTDFEFY